MSMFSTKEEVDNHVRKILSFRNQFNKDRQSLMISKWYYDVKSYVLAKHYIDEFIKIQESSQEALLLKAKIHENLSEFDLASGSYERLYDLFSEKNYIVKASELLLKSEIRNENKVKKCIQILEKICPTDEIYIKLKKSLSPNAIFSYSYEEIANLKAQIKINANDDLKLRFLRILENQNGVVNSLEECQILMDSYRIMENSEAVKIILAIFQKYFNSDQIQLKNHYCLILIASIRDVKVCEFDRKSLLLDFFNLLKNEKLNDINRILFQFLIYFLSMMSHCAIIKHNKPSIVDKSSVTTAISNGYSICYYLNNSEQIHFSPNISAWLRSQISLIRSISNHFVNFNEDSHVKLSKTPGECIATLAEQIWNNDGTRVEITDIIVDNFNIIDPGVKSSTVDTDLQCLAQHFSNLKLIGWQLFCLNKFPNSTQFNYHLNPALSSYIRSIVTKLFTKLPLEVVAANKKAPENISKIDLIVFLLGALLTYQKSYNNSTKNEYCLPYPFEMWLELRTPEVIHKWWQGATDFLLLGKRNTSIGVLRDLLKNGLDSLQLVDNQMSEVLKLQLARLSIDCAKCFDGERNSLMKRAISFCNSVIQPSSFKTLPISTFVAAQGFVSRQKSFTMANPNVSFSGGFRVTELFDTDYVSDEIVTQWKFDAVLAVVDWRLLQQQPIKNVGEIEEMEKLIEIAEEMQPKSAGLFYCKSRLFAAKCQAMQSRSVSGLKYSNTDYNRYLKLAFDCANEAMVCTHELPREQQSNMQESIKTLMNMLATFHAADEYSIMEFSCIGETCNSNKSIVSNDFFNQSLISADQSITIDNEKLEQLRYDVVGLSTSQEKIGSEIVFCLDQVDNLKKFVKNELSNIDNNKRVINETKIQNELFDKLLLKIDDLSSDVNNLNRKTELIEFQSKMDHDEMKYFKKNMDYLTETVDKLTMENNSLKNKLKITNITGNIIQPEMNKVDNMINNYFQQCFNNANIQIQTAKLKVAKPQGDSTENIKTEPCSTIEYECPIVENSNVSERVEPTQSGLDMFSKFNQNKWQCPTCACMNDDKFAICPACQTANPKAVKNHEKPTSNFNLNKFVLNKWECPTCACMNNDDLNKCPACKTANPKSVKEEPKKQSNFDLLKFSTNKWECPTCACMNNDELNTCPACKTANPKSVKEEPKKMSNFDLSKFSTNKWECPTCACMNNDELNTCPACSDTKPSNNSQLPSKSNENNSIRFGNSNRANKASGFTFGSSKQSTNTANSQSFVFGSSQSAESSETQNFAVNFGNNKNDEETKSIPKVMFGSVSSQLFNDQENNNIDFNFGKSLTNTDVIKDWICECTTLNKPDRTECIACDKKMNGRISLQSKESDCDSDVILVSEPYVTEEQKARARALYLPDHFYAFENLSDNESSEEGETPNESGSSYDEENEENKEENYQSEEEIDQGETEENEKILEDNSFGVNLFSLNSKPSTFSFDFKTTSNTFQNTLLFNNQQNTTEENTEKKAEDHPIIDLPEKIEINNYNQGKTEENETILEEKIFGSNLFSINSQTNPFSLDFSTSSNIFQNTSLFNTQLNNTEENTEEHTEGNAEDYDPEYQPIIDLPEKVEIITGEENSDCLFNERCKLYKWSNSAWTERGVGDMKILISSSTDNKKSCRLVMRREQVHKVCCNHAIVKNCPTFTDMGNKTSACWFANDFSEGNELVQEKFAIKFKSESQLDLFKEKIKDLQDQM